MIWEVRIKYVMFIRKSVSFIPVYFSSQREERDVEHYADIHMHMYVILPKHRGHGLGTRRKLPL